jgi:KaiC/GvpD/RAD55 family RecA-like ATPase
MTAESIDREIAAAREKAIADAQRSGTPTPIRLLPDLVDDVLALPSRRWAAFAVGGTYGEIAEIPVGNYAVVAGGSGSGKSTLALQIAVNFAADHGWVLFVSAELQATESAARIVGMYTDTTWSKVIKGPCGRAQVEQGLSRLSSFAIIDGPHAKMDVVARAVAEMQTRYPDVTGLVVFDYLGIFDAGSNDRDERARISRLSEEIRRFLQNANVAGIVVTQVSRANQKGLARGDLLGAETISVAAESAQVERGAALVLVLGDRSEPGDDGSVWVSLSIGKQRFGAGDQVFRLNQAPCGRWRIDSPPQSAAVARAAKGTSKSASELQRNTDAILGRIHKDPGPWTRTDLRDRLGVATARSVAAINALLESGELVEVRKKLPKARAWQITTPAHAKATGLAIVPRDDRSDRSDRSSPFSEGRQDDVFVRSLPLGGERGTQSDPKVDESCGAAGTQMSPGGTA